MTAFFKGKNMTKQVEILAPAGSKESLKAAVTAGASAVYLGGSKFGARAYADNFDETSLLEAIDYVHLHGRKLYLTINTLLKNEEVEQELYDYLLPLYRQGLDAVIVQDPGVIEFVNVHFPGISIHASTQMTITGASGAKFVKEQGVERVVPARELTLQEVKSLKEESDMEVECFVHGALCYCYSGQCYMSSLIGGRSGNRGQCAQPCRLLYQTEGKSKPVYMMSLKDICTLEFIPDLIEAGIDSFKIEGRMKRPEYVAGVTRIYKKYVDLYYKTGREGFAVDPGDKEQLMDLYNRGGFHNGYYVQKNGPEMLASVRPNHAGVPAVKIEMQKGQIVTGKALTGLHKGDVMELPGCKDDYTLGNDIKKGGSVVLSLRKGVRLTAGTILSRVRNEALLKELQENTAKEKMQEKVKGKLILSSKKPAKLVLTCREESVEILGETPELALNKPTDGARICEQLKKTGNTPFQFETLDIEMTESLFVPMQVLNEMRRQGTGQLEKRITEKYRRNIPSQNPYEKGAASNEAVESHTFPNCFFASVETKEQMEAVALASSVGRVYLDCGMVWNAFQNPVMKNYIHFCQKAGKEAYYVMPYIFRKETEEKYEESYAAFLDLGFDGILVRNYESIYFLKKHGYRGAVVLDHNLYEFNHYSKQFFERNGFLCGTAPIELNETELQRQGIGQMECIIYGHLPMMVSAQCMQKTIGGCTGKSNMMTILDRYQNKFIVKNFCDCCYNVIYNTKPLMLADLADSLKSLNPKGLRLRFTVEDADMVEEVLAFCESALAAKTHTHWKNEFTRGHFRRGIK